MRGIPLKSMEKIFRMQKNFRVSDDAKLEIKKLVEKEAKKIASGSLRFSRHAKRNTVLESDIELSLD